MTTTATSIPQVLWRAEIPVHITHASASTSTPFVTTVPRFSYLALLLPRLTTYFGAPCSSFHHEDVLLRNLAVGLLVDLYRPTLPWRLVVSDGVGWDIGDTFLNCVKEVSSFFVTSCTVSGGQGTCILQVQEAGLHTEGCISTLTRNLA